MWIVLLAIIYFLSARLGLAFVLQPDGVAPIWPPAGVFLAALLLTPRSRRPVLTAALFLVDVAAELLAGIPPTLSLIFSATLTGQALLSAELLTRFGGPSPSLARVREVVAFVLLSAGLANVVTAVPAAAGSAVLTGSNFLHAWMWWWVSGATGILIVTPVALTAVHGGRELRRQPTRRRIEAVAVLVGIVVTSGFVFATSPAPGRLAYSFAYLTFPLLIWAAARFGPFGAAAGILPAAAIAIWTTLHGVGPLALSSRSLIEGAFQLQVYLGVLSITLLLIAALVAEVERARHEAEAAERAQAESLAQLDAVFASAPVGLAFHDRDLRFVRINERLAGINGRPVEAHYGHTLAEMVPAIAPIAEPLLRQVLESGRALTDRAMSGRTPAAPTIDRHWLTSYYPVSGPTGVLTGVGVVVLETTEQKRLELQLVQAQRMEAVGRLAGGIAHDFNNLVTAILGYAALIKESAEADPAIISDADEIEKAGQRAADLTAQLLAFARKQVVEPRVVLLGDLIVDMERLLRRLIGENIALATHVDPGLWPVKVDPTRMEQVVANLVVNARDAMPDGGRLTIELANTVLDQEYSQDRREVIPGPYVMLAVSDTGVGMSGETMQRIFEPFFTTKPVGRGTGLGLATCYGIVKQAGGNIWAYSEAGRGTSIKVYLPRAMEAPGPLIAAAAPPRGVGGRETVLVVEDESQIRDMITRSLARQGYTVLACARGEEALAAAADESRGIDLLVTDVVLPGWSGREIATSLEALRPGLRTLYISGYTENTVVHHGVLEEGVQFLAKPFTPAALALKVREVLDRSRPA